MLKRFLASRLAGPVIIALAAAAIGGGAFGAYQKNRADDAVELADSRLETNLALTSINTGYLAAMNAQTASIEALATRREEGRVIYLQDYARAAAKAEPRYDRAAELLALQGEFTDELAECRATKLLLQEELLP